MIQQSQKEWSLHIQRPQIRQPLRAQKTLHRSCTNSSPASVTTAQRTLLLFTENSKYFHQHDGFKGFAEMLKNCQNYATFCPNDDCRFVQNGEALIVSRAESCHILVPYLWSEMPANNRANGNLEPHTGWEYIVATARGDSSSNYSINYFAELETTYSVAFNWADPAQTSDLVAQSALHLLSLPNSASKGECENPIAPTVTRYLNDKSRGASTWRQQGDAVVLAVGGICHVAVPYSAQVGRKLKTGNIVLTLRPATGHGYSILDAVDFSRPLL